MCVLILSLHLECSSLSGIEGLAYVGTIIFSLLSGMLTSIYIKYRHARQESFDLHRQPRHFAHAMSIVISHILLRISG